MRTRGFCVLSTRRWLLLGIVGLFVVGDSFGPSLLAQQDIPTATLGPAPLLEFVNRSDSNSPAVWDLIDGRATLHVLNSIDGRPELSAGRNLLRLQPIDAVTFSTAAPPEGVWMEAVIEDGAGTWYGYYHNEVSAECPGASKVAPRIGAARSQDHGRTWEDLGPILEMSTSLMRCQTNNHYFVGGVGDFSAVLDADKQHLYFFYIAFLPDLINPKGWSAPSLLLEGGEWYPQVVGLAFGTGTDKQAGEAARFYMGGKSERVIRFAKP